MFTDVVGSTAVLEWLGDEVGTEALRRHFMILRRAATAHGGRPIKNLGDGLMVIFADPASAARCAAAMQRAIARHNLVSIPLGLRIGLHSGETMHDNGDYFGMPVVIAKRLCDLCEAGQVIASSSVSVDADDVQELGAVTLKGLTTPVDAISLRWSKTPLTVVARRAAS
jgi:class 3 adenylate cyclase